jgi:hypothetical protein
MTKRTVHPGWMFGASILCAFSAGLNIGAGSYIGFVLLVPVMGSFVIGLINIHEAKR